MNITQQPATAFKSVADRMSEEDPTLLLRFYIVAIESILLKTKRRIPEDAYHSLGVLTTIINNILPAFFSGVSASPGVVTDALEEIIDMHGAEEFSNAVSYIFEIYGKEKSSDHLPDAVHQLDLLRTVDNAFRGYKKFEETLKTQLS